MCGAAAAIAALKAPEWLEKRMDKLSKMPPPTVEEVKTQLKASEAMRKMLDTIPVVSQQEFVEMLTKR